MSDVNIGQMYKKIYKHLSSYNFINIIVFGFIFILLILIVLEICWLPPDKQNQEFVEFKIEQNMLASEIAEKLYQKGFIRNQTAFLLYLRNYGYERKLKAGTYKLSNSMSVREIVNELIQGNDEFVKITILEGYDLNQIKKLLVNKGLVEQKKLENVLRDGKFNYYFLEDLPSGEKRLEGFLFPDTYFITKGMTEKEIVDMFLRGFEQQVIPLIKENPSKFSILELVTLASMVEKEARLAEERPIIAGVLFNRLQKGMLLQIDATVLYALGQHQEKLYTKDLEIDSPYNTYRYPGLPPGPIACPGLSSIEAVLNPADHNYLYYVAKPDGSHVFSCTLKEHNEAKYRYSQLSMKDDG